MKDVADDLDNIDEYKFILNASFEMKWWKNINIQMSHTRL